MRLGGLFKEPEIQHMKLGVISDTHAHYLHTCEAIRMLESLEVDEVIHCGDIGSREIIPLFAAWPTHFILGNVDGDDEPWGDWIDGAAERTFHGRFGSVARLSKLRYYCPNASTPFHSQRTRHSKGF